MGLHWWLMGRSGSSMKTLHFTDEVLKLLNDLSHMALKSSGLEAYGLVKQLEAWLNSSTAPEFKPAESE
jgi:hypothetical protein